VYPSAAALRKHLVRQPLCETWATLCPGIKDYVDDSFAMPAATEGEQSWNERRCGACSKAFANVGNLNRHLLTSVVCGKWAMYRKLKPLEPYFRDVRDYASAPRGHAVPATSTTSGGGDDTQPVAHAAPGMREAFTAPAYRICHIIWNVFLIDREFAMRQDMRTVLRENGITYVVAILPRDSRLSSRDPPFWGLEHGVLPYDDHEERVDLDAYDEQCRQIEARRAERQNVVVFCNNGYQRSLPFLCHYLTAHHADEVPDVARAVNIVLPQVDKDQFAKCRDRCVQAVDRILTTSK
jgi:hypothetical protein